MRGSAPIRTSRSSRTGPPASRLRTWPFGPRRSKPWIRPRSRRARKSIRSWPLSRSGREKARCSLSGCACTSRMPHPVAWPTSASRRLKRPSQRSPWRRSRTWSSGWGGTARQPAVSGPRPGGHQPDRAGRVYAAAGCAAGGGDQQGGVGAAGGERGADGGLAFGGREPKQHGGGDLGGGGEVAVAGELGAKPPGWLGGAVDLDEEVDLRVGVAPAAVPVGAHQAAVGCAKWDVVAELPVRSAIGGSVTPR